jgi:metallo-beta-lactamase class B
MCTRCAFIGAVAGFAALPALASAATGDPQALEIAMPGMRRVSDTLWLGQLSPNVWIHTTTRVLDGVGYYPANGAIVVTPNGAVLIDTGWSASYARAILDAWERMKLPPVTQAVATHFHTDRTGGIDELTRRGVPTYGNPLTIGLAQDNGFPVPRPLHDVEKHRVNLGAVEVFYPGAGHTLDNVVVWVPGDAVLFGGCLVKSTTAPDLGNLDDANVPAWPATMRVLARTYAPRHVIPGHGTIAGDSLAHTAALAKAANKA